MTDVERFATGVVRTWIRIYTAGAAPAIRDGRRAEIESDLWEHAHAEGDRATDSRAIAGQILARCFLGIGADLSWRVQVAVGERRLERKAVPMSDIVRRNWWIPAPTALIAFGVYQVLSHIVGDGYESAWQRTVAGWNPSLLERSGTVAVLGLMLVVLPVLALAVRRSHPGLTPVLLAPWILYSMIPLMWSDAGKMLVFPALGIVTLVGAFANLAQSSVAKQPSQRSATA